MFNASKKSIMKMNIKERKIILSLKGIPYEKAVTVAKIAMQCGITAFEVSLKSPYSGKLLECLWKELGNEAVVGAGDVFCTSESSHDVTYACQQGAMFVDAPIWCDTFADKAREYDCVTIGGADTLTEIYRVHNYTASFVRLAISSSVTPKHIQEISSLIEHISLCMYGDLSEEELKALFAAGLSLYILNSSTVQELAAKGNYEEMECFLRNIAAACNIKTKLT